MITSKYFDIKDDIVIEQNNIIKDILIKFFESATVQKYLDENKFDELYLHFKNTTPLRVGMLTKVLLKANVDFLSHMKNLPCRFLSALPQDKFNLIEIPNNIETIEFDAFETAGFENCIDSIILPKKFESIDRSLVTINLDTKVEYK